MGRDTYGTFGCPPSVLYGYHRVVYMGWFISRTFLPPRVWVGEILRALPSLGGRDFVIEFGRAGRGAAGFFEILNDLLIFWEDFLMF